MLVTKSRIQLPTQKVVAEYLLRNGSPRTDSLSPYEGGFHVIEEQFKNGGIDIGYFINSYNYTDWKAANVRPVPGPYVKGSTAVNYLKRLEDIDESWFNGYATWVLVGFKKNAKAMPEYQKNNMEVKTLVDDDGQEVLESEYLVENDLEFSPQERAQAVSKLPYLIKRLHERSKQMQVHLISLIVAYEKSKQTVKGRQIAPHDYIEKGVYFMYQNGDIGGLVTMSDNTKSVFPLASKWIRGIGDSVDSYFNNMMELLSVCRILGIDITKEDPFDFQESFVSQLTTCYVARNKDYIYNKHCGINSAVLDALQSIKLDDYDMRFGFKYSEVPEEYTLTNTMQVFLDSTVPTDGYAEQDLANFTPMLICIGQDFGDLDDLVAINGFLCNHCGKPIQITVQSFCSGIEYPAPALIHVSGYAVQLTSNGTFYYQTLNTLTQYITSYIRRTIPYDTYFNNEPYGKWREETV